MTGVTVVFGNAGVCPEFQFEEITPESIAGLDPIQVYWRNLGPGRGSVVITCWGSAWTCYWGGMGEHGVRSFFASADVDYLVNKLGYAPTLKERKRDLAYLEKIVRAIKAHLLSEVPTE